jgi:hypothetical protein
VPNRVSNDGPIKVFGSTIVYLQTALINSGLTPPAPVGVDAPVGRWAAPIFLFQEVS